MATLTRLSLSATTMVRMKWTPRAFGRIVSQKASQRKDRPTAEVAAAAAMHGHPVAEDVVAVVVAVAVVAVGRRSTAREESSEAAMR